VRRTCNSIRFRVIRFHFISFLEMLRVGQRLWRSGRQRSLDSPTITAVAAGLGLTTVATVAGVTLLTGTASSHDAGGAHFRSAALLKLPGRLGRDVWTAAGMLFASVDLIPRCGFLSCSHTFGHIVACSTPAITADYLYALRDVEPGSETYEERLAACHDRGAQRLLSCVSRTVGYISSWDSTSPCWITCCRLRTCRP